MSSFILQYMSSGPIRLISETGVHSALKYFNFAAKDSDLLENHSIFPSTREDLYIA
ncbi:hypothetical protein BKA69DRAFT_187970 [Paraphysoderma sedebokerense]|nr:hypothetical protein BKA69DRAFT_187970 [Paraphysoderma sedebokerense]